MRTGQQQGTWSWSGFGVAAGVTVLLMGAVEAGAVQLAVQKKARDVRKGWNMMPVLRVTRDLPDRAVLKSGDFEPGLAPEQFVTDSVLPPEELTRLASRTVYPAMMKGDLLLQSHFQPPQPGQACVALVEQEAKGLGLENDPSVRGFLEAVRTEAGGTR